MRWTLWGDLESVVVPNGFLVLVGWVLFFFFFFLRARVVLYLLCVLLSGLNLLYFPSSSELLRWRISVFTTTTLGSLTRLSFFESLSQGNGDEMVIPC